MLQARGEIEAHAVHALVQSSLLKNTVCKIASYVWTFFLIGMFHLKKRLHVWRIAMCVVMRMMCVIDHLEPFEGVQVCTRCVDQCVIKNTQT